MSAQKLVACLAIALIAVIATEVTSDPNYNYYASNNKSYNLSIGYRQPGDKLMLRENVVVSSSWMQVKTVTKKFNVSQWYRITLVEAIDQKTNGNGARPSLIAGGPGYSNVTLKFTSQRGHGINFVVNVYAR
ncbi:putative salivary secreted peptide [Megalopta genalis]|uniref:putative salivary secreted peptide n=1 Tax=Megalopta genalis TaxID=115081 RepID=UPI003FD3D615